MARRTSARVCAATTLAFVGCSKKEAATDANAAASEAVEAASEATEAASDAAVAASEAVVAASDAATSEVATSEFGSSAAQ